MAKVAHLGPLVAIFVNILQDLSIGSISKNVPLDELFQLSQLWGGGCCHGQTDNIAEWLVESLLASSKEPLKNQILKAQFFSGRSKI